MTDLDLLRIRKARDKEIKVDSGLLKLIEELGEATNFTSKYNLAEDGEKAFIKPLMLKEWADVMEVMEGLIIKNEWQEDILIYRQQKRERELGRIEKNE